MNDIGQQLRTYIIENFLFGDDKGFYDSVSFLESGILDSTGILEVIGFLEENFSIKVEDEELIPENLDSIKNLVGYLGRKMGTA